MAQLHPYEISNVSTIFQAPFPSRYQKNTRSENKAKHRIGVTPKPRK